MAGGGERVRRLGAILLCLGAGALLSGCHHRQPPVTQPAVLPALDHPPPVPASPSMASKPPESITEAEPVKVTKAKPKRTPKKTVAKTSGSAPSGSAAAGSSPAMTAAATAPATSAEVPAAAPIEASGGPAAGASPIGALSAGGDAAPKAQQDAAELIATSEKRVDALPQTGTAEQQTQVRQVRYFLKQAKQALGTGDAEGAKTLATKAKLLMDDLEK